MSPDEPRYQQWLDDEWNLTDEEYEAKYGPAIDQAALLLSLWLRVDDLDG